jgi:hypothetical protein
MPQKPDSPEIENDDDLWRMFFTDGWNQNSSDPKVDSAAFKTDGEGEVSVEVERMTSPQSLFTRFPRHHAAVLPAGFPGSLNWKPPNSEVPLHYTVYFWDDGTHNPAHAHIHPPDGINKHQRDKRAKMMAERARIVFRP